MKYRIRWAGGICGSGTETKGIYDDFEECKEDFDQAVFMQPENNYSIEEAEEFPDEE